MTVFFSVFGSKVLWNRGFFLEVHYWITVCFIMAEYNTDYLYKLLTIIVIWMVVYSSLPVMGTTANIICITWHLICAMSCWTAVKTSSVFENNFPCTGCFSVETWPLSHGFKLDKYGVITLPNPSTKHYFHIVCWLGCDIVIHYEGIYGQFCWLLPSCMAEMVLQKW